MMKKTRNDARYPNWEERRHGWEPVKTMSKPKKPLRFEYWKSVKNNQWYWRIRSGNGEPIAQSEGYKSKRGVLKAFHLLFDFEVQPECVEQLTSVRGWPAPTKLGRKPKHFEGSLSRNFP